jgi:hypothetical protein
VINAKLENMEICANNNVLQGVKATCVKKIPEIVQTGVLQTRLLVINVTFVKPAGMDSTVTCIALLAVKNSNARKVTVNAQMDVLIIL